MAGLLTIEQALDAIVAEVRPLPCEPLPLADARGRVLCEPLIAGLDLPPFTNSAMDGYALRAGDGAGPLRVIGEAAAGVPFERELGAGEAVAISTGAALPDGADAVAPIEIVEVSAGGASISLQHALALGANVREHGSDVARGDTILAAGTMLGPAQIGAAAALGAETLACGRRPTVAIVSTGTELRPLGSALGRGQIYDSNGPMLAAAATRVGASTWRIAAVADSEAAHREAFAQAHQCDVVLTAGGVSVGAHDLVRDVQRSLGAQERFWGIAMRPGKPLSFAVRERDDGDGRTLLFGLPGNPVSALVCFELFVAPALRALQGAADPGPRFRTLALGATARRRADRDDLIRVALSDDGTVALPLSSQQSHQIGTGARADGVVRIPRGAGEVPRGATVSFLPI